MDSEGEDVEGAGDANTKRSSPEETINFATRAQVSTIKSEPRLHLIGFHCMKQASATHG
jgi:hypothetical protein